MTVYTGQPAGASSEDQHGTSSVLGRQTPRPYCEISLIMERATDVNAMIDI